MSESPFITPAGINVPAVSTNEMRAVDRVAVEDVGLALLQMMENAGRTLAWHVRDVDAGPVLVIAGNGGNGGGGLVSARHLANHEIPVAVVLDRDPEELTGETAQQYRILAEMDVPVSTGTSALDSAEEFSVLVDALFGYGLRGSVREPARSIIEAIENRGLPTVSLDVPSGIDATTGKTLGAAVAPNRIVTLALPKTGLVGWRSSLYLADIGIPRTVYERLGIEYTNPFGAESWVALHSTKT